MKKTTIPYAMDPMTDMIPRIVFSAVPLRLLLPVPARS
jgi:hypothetical protein